MTSKQIGMRIKAERKRHKLTQGALAAVLGVTDKAVSNWETGVALPAVDTFIKLCEYLGVSMDSFVSQTHDEDIEKQPGMCSIRSLYKVGKGPSSAHTLATERICKIFRGNTPSADRYRVTLFGESSSIGKLHGIEGIIKNTLSPIISDVEFDYFTEKAAPATIELRAYTEGTETDFIRAFTNGGGDIDIEGTDFGKYDRVYGFGSFSEIASVCKKNHMRLWEYVEECEGDRIWNFLRSVWGAMKQSVFAGLEAEGVLPGGLGVMRKAKLLHSRPAQDESAETKEHRLVCSYAYAVGEQNASGGSIVAAPTCGASGVLPAVLLYMQQKKGFNDTLILRALATAGLVGMLIKTNASVDGARFGCQAEIGSACSMAAAALGELMELDIDQIEYAAEIAIEHHLGLTCDAVRGLVQIPCIERNAVAAMRALEAVNIAAFLTDTRKISLDLIIKAMYETGKKHFSKENVGNGDCLSRLYDGLSERAVKQV